ncbi:MAG: AMP-binding protein [Peptococcaceae bacterium]|nr:AMP-binding protein [Peptococcaceae bacterium]
MPITEMLARNRRMYPGKTALIEREPGTGGRKEITWLEFDRFTNQVANMLIAGGIQPGERVAILLTNCLEWLPIYFGTLRTGALAVPLNFRFTAAEIEKCLKVSEAKVLIYGPEFIERVQTILPEFQNKLRLIFLGDDQPAIAENYEQLLTGQPEEYPDIDLADSDLAAVYFTSGTTGNPKPILLNHHNLVSACITENRHHILTHKDNFLCIPPLYHTGAKMHWFGNLIVGAKAVILRGVSPRWILEAISEEEATVVWLLVPWAQDILDAIESGEVDLKDYRLDQWWLMHIGAQPVPPSLIHRWLKFFPEHLYDTNYGLSESTGPGCVHLGIDNIHKVGAIGRPGFNWETMIVDEDGVKVEQGKVGELLVRGPSVMQGYYNNPEDTAAVLKDGWLYTGDMAQEDEDGFIYLVDRKKDVVICGGENIYPVEVEDFLHDHPDIKDVAVIGMPDTRLGEIPLAVIEVKTGRELSQEQVLEFCHQLPRYKRPRLIRFGEVPRNPTGKIEKPLLRQIHCGQSEVLSKN